MDLSPFMPPGILARIPRQTPFPVTLRNPSPKQGLASRKERFLGGELIGFVSDYMRIPELNYHQFAEKVRRRFHDETEDEMLRDIYGEQWFRLLNRRRMSRDGNLGGFGAYGYDK